MNKAISEAFEKGMTQYRNNSKYNDEIINDSETDKLINEEKHYPFFERYKARIFPWYKPIEINNKENILIELNQK